MRYAKTTSLGFFCATVLAAGCGDKGVAPKPTTESGKKEAGHTHGHGPNGGVVFDLGKYHAEFTVDHDKKECTVLIITGDKKDAKPLPVAAKELTLTTKETKTKDGKVVAPMTVKLLPKDEAGGKAAKFVGTDSGIGNVADFEGTVFGDIDGKPATGTFKE